MNNIILEMENIVSESKQANLSFEQIRNKLKEYLHYFVLDFIYNSEFKGMIFYGGSCLRVVYDLNRMSVDLDFEVEEGMDFDKFKELLRNYFSAVLGLKDKFYIKGEKKDEFVNRIFLNFPIMNEVGLSPHEDEALRVRIDTMSVSKGYLEKLKPIFTLKSKYGKSFAIRHYNLQTLFASKLVAVLDRRFVVGGGKRAPKFKGRDLYDLWWYMEKGVLPNETMLKLKGKGLVGDVFDEVALFISKTDLKDGLRNDLEPLFISPVDVFVDNFRSTFQRLREKGYINRRIKILDKIRFSMDFNTDISSFIFDYLCEDNTIVFFRFRVSDFRKGRLGNNMKLSEEDEAKIDWEEGNALESAKSCMALFLSKIDDYLKRHDNAVYFTWWESKFIRMTDDNFNPEKEIVFSSGRELASNKKVTLETLSL